MIERSSVVAVALLAVAAHATELGGGYVWLDHAHLERGLALAVPGEFLRLFGEGFAGTGFYRPLVALSLSIDALFSDSPAFFRVVTLGWHVLASVMTFVTAERFGVSRGAALAAGALFAVHPATGLVASATAFRSEAMLLFFLLGLVVAHRAERPALAGLALLAAALTKETGWVLGPLFVVAMQVVRFRKQRRFFESKGRVRLLAAEALAFVLSSALHLAYAPTFRAEHARLTVDEHVGSRLAAFAKSALALTVPYDPGEAERLLEPETKRDDALPAALIVRAKTLHALGREPEAMALVERVRREKMTTAEAR